MSQGFPCGPVVKNLPSNAGHSDLIPDQGTKIPLATGRLSPCTTIIELASSGALMPELEKSMLHNKELPCATMETQHSKKKKKKKMSHFGVEALGASM